MVALATEVQAFFRTGTPMSDFDAFVLEWRGFMRYLAKRYAKIYTDIDDIYQESLIRLWKSSIWRDREKFCERKFIMSCLVRLVRFAALNWWETLHGKKIRDKEVRRKLNFRQLPARVVDPASLPKDSFLLDVMAQLSPGQREVVNLLAQGYRQGDIAQELGIPSTTVWQRVHRAKVAVNQILNPTSKKRRKRLLI